MRFHILFSLFSALSSKKAASASLPAADEGYEPPLFVIPGGVRRITLGSSPSGNADANSQYYW